jgi:raffinose/stachyose/melibiose transport system permease protein
MSILKKLFKKNPDDIAVENQKYTIGTFITQLIVLAVALIYMAPLYIIINYAFKTKKELYLGNPLAMAENFNLDNFIKAFDRLDLVTTFFNTAFYTLAAVAILVFVCGPAAWAIARGKSKFYKFSYIYFIIGILIPAQALFLPIYIVGYSTGLVNTRFGVIFMFVATNISFGIFLLTSFMSTVPVELEEAACIDGCSVFRTFFTIVLPLLKPALVTLIIMQSFQIWNDYLMSSLFVSENKLKPMTVAIQSLFSQQTSDYSTAFAAIVISVLPIAILFVALQKYFIKGMTVGAVKG